MSDTLIYGLGRSGRGVARFLSREGRGAECPTPEWPLPEWMDARPSDEDRALMEQLGFARGDAGRAYRTVVAAPGVPIDHPDLQRLRAAGAEVIGEAELACRARPGLPMVGVTGTAGKGSTTVLIASLLRASGVRALEGGNIDPPLLDVVDAAEVAVVELSSFQLERVKRFRPAVAVITNLGVDHLDRHGSEAAYHATKLNITAAQTEDDVLIVPAALTVNGSAVNGSAVRTAARVQHFDPARLVLADGTVVLDVSGLPEGLHPANAAAALLAAEALLERLGRRADAQVLASALSAARPVKGRFETVVRQGGLRFVNDSIATRTVAVEAALRQAASPIAWLVGGRDKGADLGPLRLAAAERVRQVVAFGEDGERFARLLGLPFVVARGETGDEVMRRAVQLAADSLAGEAQGTVLLAPIGTSFDLYRDYVERGEAFTRAAQAYVQARPEQPEGARA